MVAILFLVLLAVPIVELWIIVEVAGGIGVINTLALLFLVSAAGAWLLRQQGLATWRRLQATLARGDVPTKEVADGFLILLGGALLLTPGFLTDGVGLVLLLPPTRLVLKGAARKMLGRWASKRTRVYSTRVIRIQPDDVASPRREERRADPSLSAGEDDSPDEE